MTWLGSRDDFASQLSLATGIDERLFKNDDDFEPTPRTPWAVMRKIQKRARRRRNDVLQNSIAKRMSWAARRETTRPEDISYCLLGIFDVNMPLLYGEGEEKAFSRLQEEILKHSNDQSILAWSSSNFWGEQGPLATHPKQFSDASRIVPLPGVPSHYAMMSSGC
jgi:hypothetical protein